jgi:hypothetical protein
MQKVRNLARWLVFMAFFVLASCASLGLGSNASFTDRYIAFQRDYSTAKIFIAVYTAFPTCAVGITQPCKSKVVVDVLKKTQKDIDAVIVGLDALLAAGAAQDELDAKLREAQGGLSTIQKVQDNAAT